MTAFTELGRMIEAISKDRGIERSVVIHALEQSFLITIRRKFGLQGEYEVRYNEAEDKVDIFQYKTIVESPKDIVTEISLNEAKALDPSVVLGDQIGFVIKEPNFTRVDVQTVRQVIFQKVRDAEREILFSEFKHREGEIIAGIIRRYEKGNVIVDLGKSDAVLPKREIIPGENFKTGDRVSAYLSDVVMTIRGPEIRLSRTSPLFLVKLFEMEVPEIQDGSIEIKSAAREPGQRAKIAVYTEDRDIDPVGACVGMKGSRVQNIVNELQGEKIDIVRWSEDMPSFVKAALAPAEIVNVVSDSDQKSLDVIVDDDQLSMAIGRRGQNVRLAAMLTGLSINIISRVKLQEKVNRAVESLIQVSSLNDALAQILVQNGLTSVQDVSGSTVEEIQQILSVEEDFARRVITDAKLALTEGKVKASLEEESEIISAQARPEYSGIELTESLKKDKDQGNNPEGKQKFLQAEKRLREELAAFKLK